MTNFDEWLGGYKVNGKFHERKSIITFMEDAFLGGFDYATSICEERQQKDAELAATTANKQSTPCKKCGCSRMVTVNGKRTCFDCVTEQ